LKPKDFLDHPRTLGEHIKKVRRERGLLQRDVAKSLRVDSMSIVNWERDRTKVGARFVPAIIRWLGYDPLPKARSIGEWIVIGRTRRGMARRQLARVLRWDEGTLRQYEENRAEPDARRLAQLHLVLDGVPG
jgi:transcriptional regulator with XRE-family HTH domain